MNNIDKEIEIVMKLYGGRELTKKDWDWVNDQLCNGKQTVPATSRNINGQSTTSQRDGKSNE